MTTPPEPAILSHLGDRDRVAIIAGGGNLPVELARILAAAGHPPLIVAIAGECDAADGPLSQFERRTVRLEEFGRLATVLRKAGATHVVLAGTVERRPSLLALKWTFDLVAMLPRVVAGLRGGDDTVLRVVVGHLEARGFQVVGAHDILPALLAPAGPLTRAVPSAADRRDIAAGLAAAHRLGELDIGQAAVAIGGRVIAVEGIEGTDGLLARVAEMRGHGRLAGATGGVLVKCAKPGQEVRADLPTIGPATVAAADAAGLSGIAVEAGRTLVLDQAGLVRSADRLGLFVVGERSEPA